MLSQGDVAVGRCNRKDVAGVLVEALASPDAQGKTFEMLSLRGYEKPRSLNAAFSRLALDDGSSGSSSSSSSSSSSGGGGDDAAAVAVYALLQQLLPGEVQDPTQLE